MFFLKQIIKNELCKNIFDYLKSYYEVRNMPKESFFSQQDQVKKISELDTNFDMINELLEILENNFKN